MHVILECTAADLEWNANQSRIVSVSYFGSSRIDVFLDSPKRASGDDYLMISIAVTYRIISDQHNDLWEVTKKSIGGLLDTADVDFELIVFDNGSHSAKYAMNLDAVSRMWYGTPHLMDFKQFRFDTSKNLSVVWNTAIYQSEGDYIGLFNNDIYYWEKGWMSRMIEPFSWTDRKIGIVGIQHMSWYKWAFTEGSAFIFPTSFRDEFKIGESEEEPKYSIVMDEQFWGICDVDFNARVQQAGYECIQVNNPPLQPRWLQHLGHRTLNSLANTNEVVVHMTHEDRNKLCDKWGVPRQIVD
jgi:hypothetical protein